MTKTDRILGGLLAGLGGALIALAVPSSRYVGQRVLYVVAGALFVIAGLYRVIRKEPGQP